MPVEPSPPGPAPAPVATSEPVATREPAATPEDDDRAEPIELHRVTSSAPPPRGPVPPPAAPLDTVPPAPAVEVAPSAPVPTAPAAAELAPRSAEPVVPAVVPERDFGHDSVDLPLRTDSALRLPLWIGAGVLAAVFVGGVLWALASEDEEAAPVDVASAPREVEAARESAVQAPDSAESAESVESQEEGSSAEAPVAEVVPDPEPPAAEAPLVAETVSVSLRVIPRLSRVEVNGELWRSPYERSLPRSDETHRVVVSRRGYETAERELAGDEDHDITIRLRRERPRARTTPRAATTQRPAVVRRPPPPPRRSPAKRPRPRRRRLGAGFTTSNPY